MVFFNQKPNRFRVCWGNQKSKNNSADPCQAEQSVGHMCLVSGW